jgi:hypothetical protein
MTSYIIRHILKQRDYDRIKNEKLSNTTTVRTGPSVNKSDNLKIWPGQDVHMKQFCTSCRGEEMAQHMNTNIVITDVQ